MATREQVAEMLLRDVSGLDFDNDAAGANPNPSHLGAITTMEHFDNDASSDPEYGADDPVKRAGLSTLPFQIQVANLSALSLDLLKIDDEDAAALPTGVVAPTIIPYKNVIRYLHANPSMLQSVLIGSNESGTTGAPLMQSLRITPKRVTPFGLTSSNEVRIQSYQTPQDFQANRATIPLAWAMDGFSFLNLVTDTNGSGATVTFNVTLMIGKRNDGRKPLRGQPMTMKPGGRGPAPAGR